MRHLLLLPFVTLACTPASKQDTCGGGQDATHLIVTDIDETLTTFDSEYWDQVQDPKHDPAMRPDANTLMNALADKGYRIIYITGRSEKIPLADGTSTFDATDAWLNTHDFPRTEGDLFLNPGIALGDTLVQYKADTIKSFQDQGLTIDRAYGNASTDIDAYRDAKIPEGQIYLVGKLADDAIGDDSSTYATIELISTDDAYTAYFTSIEQALTCAGESTTP